MSHPLVMYGCVPESNDQRGSDAEDAPPVLVFNSLLSRYISF